MDGKQENIFSWHHWSAYPSLAKRRNLPGPTKVKAMEHKDEALKPFDYIAEAAQTVSPGFYGELVPHRYLKFQLEKAIHVLNELDTIKKALFYGEPLMGLPNGVPTPTDGIGCPDTMGSDAGVCMDILHGILGVATEGGEMLEALYAAYFEGKDFDKVNLLEESGDVMWYLALLLNKPQPGVTFEAVQHLNIDKLRKRYPDKFTNYDALNRNLEAEREVLERQPGDVHCTGHVDYDLCDGVDD